MGFVVHDTLAEGCQVFTMQAVSHCHPLPYTIIMRPRLWSKLPLELICCIIEQTDGDASLDNWCVATQHDKRLHKTALHKRWCELKVDLRDLIAEKESKSNQGSRKSKITKKQKEENPTKVAETSPRKKLIDELTTKYPSGLIPASYIQRLFLDFAFEFNQGMHLLPPEATFCCSFSILTPLLTQVEEIVVAGTAPQEVLDAIAALPRLNNLHTLEYRNHNPRLLYREGQRVLLDWAQLRRLQWLRVLTVQYLVVTREKTSPKQWPR